MMHIYIPLAVAFVSFTLGVGMLVYVWATDETAENKKRLRTVQLVAQIVLASGLFLVSAYLIVDYQACLARCARAGGGAVGLGEIIDRSVPASGGVKPFSYDQQIV